MNKFVSILVGFIIILSLISPLISATTRQYDQLNDTWMKKVNPIFLKKISGLSDDEPVVAVVRLKPLPSNIRLQVKGHYRLAVESLKWWSKATQGPVIRFITENGGIILNRFWLDNVLLVRVKLGLLKKIAMLPNVVEIFENFEVKVQEPVHKIIVNPDQEVSSWGIFKIRAPDVWAKGYTGEGIRICVLDTGVDITHPALQGKMLTLDPTSPYYPGGWMEFDENGNPVLSQPHDTHGHGTHTSGTALGGDTENILIGVAPGATLMHGLVLPGGGGTFAQVIAGMEWAVEPYYLDPNTGEPVPTGLPAHVVSMSWGASDYYGNELLPAIENMLLANIVPVAAIGNDGPGTTSNPGNIWGVIGVGATDESDNVAYFSSGAVVDWPSPPDEWPFFDTYPSEYVKPDVSAPGVSITSAVPGGGYEAWDGTSMATPHVAGTVALILQAAGWTDFNEPDTPEEVYLILNSTAVDLGDPGQDIRYGWGRIDAFEAVSLAEQFAKTTGVEGFVYDAVDHSPVKWATVTVNETGKTVSVNGSGYFKIPLDPGTYHLVFNAFGYESQVLEVQVIELNGTIAGYVYDEITGSPIEGANVTVEELNLTVTTGPYGNFSVSVPPGTYNVTASATGYVPESQVVDVGENETVVVLFSLAPLGNGTIVGYVTDNETGAPIEGALVWVNVGSVQIVNVTNADGYYELNVPSGVYTLHVFASGYAPADVPDVNVAPNSTVVVNVSLAPLPPTVVVLGNIDYYTQPHLAQLIASLGLPVAEYDSLENLLNDWVNGLIYPKVVVVDHLEPDGSLPSNDTLAAFLLLADASGTSVVWLGTSYSGYTGLDTLYAYSDFVQSLGYPAPIGVYWGWPSPENVIVYMLNQSNPVFSGVVPDNDSWFYLANTSLSYYADYAGYVFVKGNGFVELAYINDTSTGDTGGVGVGLWNSSTGVPWFYLGSWAESYWMQYVESGSDGVYSNNTVKVLLNAVSLGFNITATNKLSLDKAKILVSLVKSSSGEISLERFKPDLYTFVEVYLNRLPYGWVTGKVVDSDGNVLAGAKVTVLGTPVETTTDENGSFLFWLPEGNYTLIISSPGYYSLVLNITVTVNETVDLDTIVLQRQPRVAIFQDYAGQIKAFLESQGLYAIDYTDLMQLTHELSTGFFDIVIYAGHYGVPFPAEDEFLEFLNTTENLGLSVIWLDQWGYYGYGIKVLSIYTGDPASFGYSYGMGYPYLRIEESHPIFRGYEVGEEVQLFTDTSADFAWFSDFSGDSIGSIVVGDTTYGSSVGYKILPNGAKWILMASFAPEEWTPMDYWTPDAFQIFYNAVKWALQKPLNVSLENPYLHVGDTAEVYVSGAPANTTLNIFLDGELIGSVVSDADGNATFVFTVPLIPGGEHRVEVMSEDEMYYGMAKLYVLVKVTVSPMETMTPGQVHVLATGLYVNQKVYVFLDLNYVSFVSANTSGAFEGELNIPLVATGLHQLSIVDIETGKVLYTVVISINNEITSSLSSVNEKLDVLVIDLSAINSSLNVAGQNISKIFVDLDSISGRLDNVINLLNNVVGQLDNISGDTAYIKTELGTITAKIEDLNATLVGLVETNTGEILALINTSVGTITTKLDNLNDLGLSLSDKLSQILDNLDNLNNKLDQAKTDLTSLINNVKQSLSSEHQEILSKLENLTHSTSKLSTEVNKNKQATTTATNMGVAGTSLGAVALAAALFTLFKKK